MKSSARTGLATGLVAAGLVVGLVSAAELPGIGQLGASPSPTVTPGQSPSPHPTSAEMMAPTEFGSAPLSRSERPPPPVSSPSPTPAIQTPEPAATPAPTPSPAMETARLATSMPADDLPGWSMTFADDFDTPVRLGTFPGAVTSRWDAYPEPWRDTSGNGLYSPQRTVSIADSTMDIWLHTEGGQHLVAAPMPKLPGGKHQLYGRYAVRFWADTIPGYKLAWLLWPESEVWPQDGEVDFPDQDLNPGARIHAFMHRQGATAGSDQDAYTTEVPISGAWHVAIIEWKPDSLTFMLDGEVVGHSTQRVPNTPMRWVLQSETSLRPEAPADATEGHVKIDWVVVWRYAP